MIEARSINKTVSTNVNYQEQLGKLQHRVVFLISKYASLCLWDTTAASTPHGGTVGMQCLPPASLFHVTFPLYWNNEYKGQENAEQRELESVRNIWLFFLALEEGPILLLWGVAGLSLFLEHVLCWSAVCSGSPSVTESAPSVCPITVSSENSGEL